tara:strand:+ start:84 stop:734 length:651 start_codon:yes stop_codon:yes gene_type:complete
MNNQRLEKKFVYANGDESFKFFLISGMFKEVYPKRVVNSIYFDTDIYQDVWDNINGFGNRKKIRLRWYDNLNNSEVFIEEKKKINFVTQKKVEKIGVFKNFDDLANYIKSKDFEHINFILDKKINLKKTLFIQYRRNYYELPNKKLRLTVDNNLNIFQKYPTQYLQLDKTIVELKYDLKNSAFVNSFIKNHNLDNRNQKFSKYVNSFIELNDNAIL